MIFREPFARGDLAGEAEEEAEEVAEEEAAATVRRGFIFGRFTVLDKC